VLPFTAEPAKGTLYTTLSFVVGGFTSIASGYIGMRIAVYANVRTTKECASSIGEGFLVAYRGGEVLGFTLVGLALLVLVLLIQFVEGMYLPGAAKDEERFRKLFEMIAGYGLGGSTVALFGRVGGGIYTKAADVGADLAGKVVQGLDEDSPSNPGTIADNVGDNVGDIAGMGADLFGSLAESTCAALVVSGTSPELMSTSGSVYFPLLITAGGIIVSFITTFFATAFTTVSSDTVERTLKWQLFISTALMTGVLAPIASAALPETFTFKDTAVSGTPFKAFCCVAAGLWAGLIIGFITEYFTNNTYQPVQELAESCRMGAAPNIILGLALGYMSNIIPILCIAGTIFVSFSYCNMYGIALSALGMLSTLPIALTIDGYGPISDNAGGIAEMTGLHRNVRHATDKLDAAGNTTAAIGKGFAIGSACLVGLALFGAFVTRTKQKEVNILDPLMFSGLLIGAMIPYAFSALTMQAVGVAAKDMIAEIKRQFNNEDIRKGKILPDYEKCIQISTQASIRKMILPGVLVLGTPFLMGLFFGPKGVSGLLAGIIVSGVQIAISFSNTGGAWDNAKKYIEAGIHASKEQHDEELEGQGPFIFQKKTEAHTNAVIGDTVGDPLKDTSGPSINILIKLSAISSLVFGDFFIKTGFLVK